jgi:hypothetical protein
MKATIDFDPILFQRLKVEAARRRRTIRELVAEGVRAVLAQPARDELEALDDTPPSWVGGLRKYARNARGVHDMASVRESVAKGRSRKRKL